ncbi:MAG TPA: hypothetical protein VKV95_00550 [Terriglobia bacterium]|nr:hypothetical protein [Terriglobia bacterium]
MGSKYKEFSQEAMFQDEPEVVREAIRAFAGNWLAGWNLSETPDGIEATGQSGGHQAKAMFRIDPVTPGARLVVALQVDESGSPDPASDNAGQDNDGVIRKWLEAIPWWIEQKKTAAALASGGHEKTYPSDLPKHRLRIGEILAIGFLITWFIVFTLYALFAFVGLVTGSLALPSKRTGNLGIIHGWTARIISAIILAFYGLIVSSLWKGKKKAKGKPWYW